MTTDKPLKGNAAASASLSAHKREDPTDRRDRLQRILNHIEPGQLVHRDEDESGRLLRDTTEDHRASLQERIAELDLEIDEACTAPPEFSGMPAEAQGWGSALARDEDD